MIYLYNDLLNRYKNDYQINKAIKENKIFKLEKGIYSDKSLVNPMAVYSKKYPNAIVTMDSAFYYYDLTDVIPDKLYLATANNDHIINNKNIKQLYTNKKILNYGKTIIKVDGEDVNIYDRERLLVELIRKRKQIPFDYYKEIIANYRDIVDELDMYKIEKYLSLFKNDINITDALQREVF